MSLVQWDQKLPEKASIATTAVASHLGFGASLVWVSDGMDGWYSILYQQKCVNS